MNPVAPEEALADVVSAHDEVPIPEQDVAVSHVSHLDEALSAFEEALGLVDRDEQPAFYGIILHDIAQTFEVAERFDIAVELYRESVSFKRRAENLADISTTLVALAQCLMSTGHLDEAFTALGEAGEALGLAAPGLDTGDLSIRMHEIGLLYERMGSRGIASAYDDAITTYRRTLELIDEETDPKSYASVLRGIGDVYCATGQLRDSASAYAEAVSLLRTTDEQNGLASTLIDLGRTKRRLAEMDGQRFLDVDAAPRLAAGRQEEEDVGRAEVEDASPRPE